MRYEYTPGFDDLDAVAVGGQGHYWFNDHVRLGLTANANDEGDTDSSLNAADLTLRMSSESWFKVQAGRSEGLVSNAAAVRRRRLRIPWLDDLSFADADAGAYRADVSVGLGDFFEGRDGRADPLCAEPRRRLLGAGPGDDQGHGVLRRHLQDAGDERLSVGAKGDLTSRGPGARDLARSKSTSATS